MAIFLRPDVGWGQGSDPCELLRNPSLDIVPGTTNGNFAFSIPNSKIPEWRCLQNSPAFRVVNNNNVCISSSSNPTLDLFPINYIHLRGDLNPTEGFMQYLSKPVVSDSYITYELELIGGKLSCEFGDPIIRNNNGKIVVKLSNSMPTNSTCFDANITPFLSSSPITLEAIMTNNSHEVYNNSFGNSLLNGNSYSQIWVYGQSLGDFITINGMTNISLKCTTTALTDIVSIVNNNSVTFSATNASSTSTFDTYDWDFGDGGSSTLPSPTHTYIAPGTYNVCVDIIDSNGCCASRCENVVIICPEILAAFTFTGDCPLYNFTPSLPISGYTYHWDFGDGGTSVDQNPLHSYNSNGTYNVCLTITDVNGCMDTLCQNIVVTCSVPWSCTPTPGFNYTYIDARPSRNISEFYPSANSLINKRLIIRGKLIIDKNFNIAFCPHILLEPGAELEVKTGVKLVFAQNSMVEACTKMWKGITVNGNANIISNTIKDAFHAVNLKDSGHAIINSNDFDENFIGIYAGESGSSPNIVSFNSNDFRSFGLLKPAYTGFAFDFPQFSGYFSGDARTWAGIYLKNQGNLNFSSSSHTSVNKFSGLKNGLVAENSSFTFKNAEIKDLQGNTYDTPVAGFGVWAKWCPNLDVDNISVENAYRGVVLDNFGRRTRRVSVQNSSFTNIDPSYTETGNTIQIRNCTGGDIKVDNNRFSNAALPIDIYEVNNFTSLSVSNNAPMSYVRGYGIRISNSSSLGTYGVVANNVMSTSVGSFGIGIYKSNNVAIHNNTIAINNPINWSNITGIDINVSDGCEVRENIVTMNLASNPNSSKGINVNASPNTLYCCNNVTGGNDGFYFRGMSTNTRFKQNTMRNATNSGMYLFYTTIGLQFTVNNSGIRAFGNIWEGAQTGNQVAKADGQFIPNLFRVDGNDDPNIGISNSTFSPTATPAQWFVPSTASTPLCSSNPLCNEDMFQGNGPWICGNLQAIGDLENSIAGVNGNVPYSEQELWTAQNYAYDYITAHPQLLAYSIPITNFYNNPGAPIVAYQSIEHNIDNIYALTPSEQIAWNTSSAASETAIASLDAINAQVTDVNFDVLYPSMLPYMATITYHHGIMNGINEDVSIRSITNATNIRSQIASMPGSQSFLAQYKLIRMIYMDYIIHGKAYVLSTYLTQINDIAGRCQLIYGESVTLARGMQAALNLEVTTTEGSCVPVTPKSKISDEIAVNNVVPNPSSDDWTANIDGVTTTINISYTMTDLQGRIVASYNGTIHPDQALTISGAALAPGVYILNLEVANVKMTPRKLIKIQ